MVDVSKSSDNIFIKNAAQFEIDIKSCMGWSKGQWIENGESGTRINKLCNSMQYWKTKLRPAMEDVSIIFTLYNSNSDVRFQIFEMVSAIESLDKNFIVQGIADFRNPRYLCVYFKDKETRDKVTESFRMYNDSYVVYLSWALVNEYVSNNLKVHWLPMTVNVEKIKEALDNYVTCVNQERINLKFMSGRLMPSGKITLKVVVKKGVAVENIPHVMEIAGMEALITISGRSPLCLNCDTLGHVSKDCDKRFCGECRVLKPKVHECEKRNGIKSFAEAVKKKEAVIAENFEPEDWGMSFQVSQVQAVETEKESLEKKINELESKIKTVQDKDESWNQNKFRKKSEGESSEQGDANSSLSADPDSESEDLSWAMDEHNADRFSLRAEDSAISSDGKHLKNSAVGFATQASKVNKKRRNRKCTSDRKKIPKVTESLVINDSSNQGQVLKTYSKKVPKSAKKSKQDQKFDKVLETREFIFKD